MCEEKFLLFYEIETKLPPRRKMNFADVRSSSRERRKRQLRLKTRRTRKTTSGILFIFLVLDKELFGQCSGEVIRTGSSKSDHHHRETYLTHHKGEVRLSIRIEWCKYVHVVEESNNKKI